MSMSLTATDKQEIRALFSAEMHALISKEIRATILPQLQEKVSAPTAASATSKKGTSSPTIDPSSLPPLPAGPTNTKLDTIYREMCARFETMQQQMNQRFEGVLKIMEIDRNHTDKRFDDMLKIMEIDRNHTDKRFEEMNSRTDKRFEEMNSRTDKRFEELLKTMEQDRKNTNRQFQFIQWLIVGGVGFLSLVIALSMFLS